MLKGKYLTCQPETLKSEVVIYSQDHLVYYMYKDFYETAS